jgi:RNA polymerase sigma-70 factor (ECF subfamily)
MLDEFSERADPYRRELLAYCYTMLGSVDDAEDLVQETYLRAWRAYDRFEGRSSLRTWLYRIATNRCLTALEGRDRRPLPSGLGGPADDPGAPPVHPEQPVGWVQPFPDPAVVVAGRESVRLALVVALQHLSARQRAVLILREVLGWTAAEVAEVLGMTSTAVHSALQHARARLVTTGAVEDETAEPPRAEQRAVLARFIAAFENADVPALVELLRADVVLEMPPFETWFAGRGCALAFLIGQVLTEPGAYHLVPISANGQPAAACYLHGRPHAITVLTVREDGIARIDIFLDPSLFAHL